MPRRTSDNWRELPGLNSYVWYWWRQCCSDDHYLPFVCSNDDSLDDIEIDDETMEGTIYNSELTVLFIYFNGAKRFATKGQKHFDAMQVKTIIYGQRGVVEGINRRSILAEAQSARAQSVAVRNNLEQLGVGVLRRR